MADKDAGTGTVDGGSDGDAALYATMERDLAAAEDGGKAGDGEQQQAEKAPVKADEKPAGEQKVEPVKDRLPYEELEKRHRDLQGALGSERGQRKAAAERVEQMETLLRRMLAEQQGGGQAQQGQPQQAKAPTLDENPIGYFEHKLAELNGTIEKLTKGSQQTTEQFRAQQEQQRFWGSVKASEDGMRAKAADYDDAIGWMEENAYKELVALYPDDAPGAIGLAADHGYPNVEAMRVAIFNNDRRNLAQQALRIGVNPAERYYEMAKVRGWKGKTTAANAQQTLAAAKAGKQASATLSGGGRATESDVSVERLAELYLEDPEAADKQFKRMKAKGLFGD